MTDASEIAEAPYIVLPGVGSFKSGMSALKQGGRDDALRERVAAGRPTLAICLGLQLLCEGSEEAPGVPGLGCVRGTVGRFSGDVRVPQLGWNRIDAPTEAIYCRSGVVYFANSYRLGEPPPGWTATTCRYGGRFVAAFERDGVLACQFHPELSGRLGQGILSRWLEASPPDARVDGPTMETANDSEAEATDVRGRGGQPDRPGRRVASEC